MFWLRHPQPVRPRKAVAEQIVQQNQHTVIDTRKIVVEHSAAKLAEMLKLQSELLNKKNGN